MGFDRIIFSSALSLYNVSASNGGDGKQRIGAYNSSSVCDLVAYRNRIVRGGRRNDFLIQNRVLLSIVIVYMVASFIYVIVLHLKAYNSNIHSRHRLSSGRRFNDRYISWNNRKHSSANHNVIIINSNNNNNNGTNSRASIANFFSTYWSLVTNLSITVLSILLSTIVFARHLSPVDCGSQFALYSTFPLLFVVPFVLETLMIINAHKRQKRARVLSVEMLAQHRRTPQMSLVQKFLTAVSASAGGVVDSLLLSLNSTKIERSGSQQQQQQQEIPPRKAYTFTESHLFRAHSGGTYQEIADAYFLFDFSNDSVAHFLITMFILSPALIISLGVYLTMPVVRQRCVDCETFAEVIFVIFGGFVGVGIYFCFLLYQLKNESDQNFRILQIVLISLLCIVGLSGILLISDPGDFDLHFIISWEDMAVFGMMIAYTAVYVVPASGASFSWFGLFAESTQQNYEALSVWFQSKFKRGGNHEQSGIDSANAVPTFTTGTGGGASSATAADAPIFVKEEIFNEILQNPLLLAEFERFVNESFIYELWRFRCEVIDWKDNYNSMTNEERIAKVVAVHQALIAQGSPFEINISDDLRADFESEVSKLTAPIQNYAASALKGVGAGTAVAADRVNSVAATSRICPYNIFDLILEEVTKILLQNINSRFIGDVNGGRMSIIASSRGTTLTALSTTTAGNVPSPGTKNSLLPAESATNISSIVEKKSEFSMSV